MLPRIGGGRLGVAAVSRRRLAVWCDAVEKLKDLTEAVKIQEVNRARRGILLRRRGVVGAAQGDGGMASIREADDEVGIIPAAQADDLDPLTTERMMRMSNGDESRRRLG
jgi:hypothetical protein